LKESHIKPVRFARIAYVSPSARIRSGKHEPTRHMMVRPTMAATLILNRRGRMDELFDLTDAGI